MKCIKSALNGVIVIEPKVHGDDRGFFKEVIHPKALEDLGIRHRFVQVNHSRSQKGILRGMHVQSPPYAQAKLVRCLRGHIFDVAVDLRPNSSSLGQWFGYDLTEDNHCMMYVPVGFAHGFLAMTDADVEYACGDVYAPDFDNSFHWKDATVNIQWPLESTPLVSKKDEEAPSFDALMLRCKEEAWF